MALILHITRRDEWESAQREESYCAASLAWHGFIHCSTPAQVIDIANGLFAGQCDLVLLCIDTERLAAEVRYENLEGGTNLFPHIYGPLNLDAVEALLDFPPQEDGHFRLPRELIGDGP